MSAKPAKHLGRCPVCSGSLEGKDLGVRDFTFINEHLPGKVRAMDVDCFLEQSRTDRALAIEYHVGPIRMGQRLALSWFRRHGADVLHVDDRDAKTKGKVKVRHMKRDGDWGRFRNYTLNSFGLWVKDWWYDT